MCCGVAQNTYHTLKDMRVVLADGSVLDTADPASRAAFLEVRALALPRTLNPDLDFEGSPAPAASCVDVSNGLGMLCYIFM